MSTDVGPNLERVSPRKACRILSVRLRGKINTGHLYRSLKIKVISQQANHTHLATKYNATYHIKQKI